MHVPSRTGHSSHNHGEAVATEVTIRREQAGRGGRGLRQTLKENSKRSQITLKNGATVDARQAVAIVEQLQVVLAAHLDEFRSLLALAEGRRQDADPRHLKSLWASAFLQNDYAIEPIVRDVLLNSYQDTAEGPVVVPLRLRDAADVPAVQQALLEKDQQIRKILRNPKRDEGRSMD